MNDSPIILGIDLGTSSIKTILLDTQNGTLAKAGRDYPVDIPHPGHGEQNPETWWRKLLEALAELRQTHPRELAAVAAIGLSGQMHGVVIVGADLRPLRPAILWLDSRTAHIAKNLEDRLGPDTVARVLHNRIFPGFALPSLVWLKENEPENHRKTAWALSPKDYLRLRLTGIPGAERSDASATAMFDVGQGDWAYGILETCGIPAAILPRCAASTDVAGTLTPACAAETGLPAGIPVVHGAGDQPAQSIGNGACEEGIVVANIGTGGQLACFSARDRYDPRLRLHTFRHAIPDGFTLFGACLASGMSLNWLANTVLGGIPFDHRAAEAAATEPGAGGLLFLPYLAGDRTPHMDPDASGVFFGLRLEHGRGHLARAVMEGVAFSLMDSLAIMEEMGISCREIVASGGGAKSPLWLQIQADVFQRPVVVCVESEQACLGAAILAGSGTGLLPGIAEAARRLVRRGDAVYAPRPAHAARYRELYDVYRGLYAANHAAMKRLRRLKT